MSSTKEYRFKYNPREKVFYDEWVASHESRRGKSHTTLEYLLAVDPNKPMGECTDRDDDVAALVIQWLGSPVGVSFLRDCGFVPKEEL